MTGIIPTKTVIIYHADCRDGFSAAWAAWKKFGDDATYIPRKTQMSPPEGLVDKEIYILDYSYSKETLDDLVAHNHSVTVIDHHQTAEPAVTAFPQNIFDQSHSGATLAWMHFHPDTPVPKLLLYVEEHDLWKNTLPHSWEIAAAIGEYSFDFTIWNQLAARFENQSDFTELAEKGKILRGLFEKQVNELASAAELITFENHAVYAVNGTRPFKSAVGNLLAQKQPPFGVVWHHENGVFHISLRSIGDFDVAKIAEKYGGGGHKNAAGLQVQRWEDLPFTFNT